MVGDTTGTHGGAAGRHHCHFGHLDNPHLHLVVEGNASRNSIFDTVVVSNDVCITEFYWCQHVASVPESSVIRVTDSTEGHLFSSETVERAV